jgi:hypothetical protein
MNNILAKYTDWLAQDCVFLLKFLTVLVILLLNIFLIFLIICIVILAIKNCFFSTSHYFPVINVSRSVNYGNTYESIISPVRIDTPVYLRYDISVKIKGFLSCFQKKDIKFELVIPCSDKMKVSIHEISCECNPDPLDGLSLSQTTRFTVLASHKKPERMKLILKCECCDNEESSIYYFRLKFVDKRLNTFYQRTASVEYKKDVFKPQGRLNNGRTIKRQDYYGEVFEYRQDV